jgi:predicted N-acetyltransferase YhbS
MSARNALSPAKIKQISMRPLMQDDVDAAHSLSVAVGWPHRAADWRAVLSVGEGLCAPDAVGRLAGTAMWWPMGKKVAAIGMVIVAPHAQGQGLGRRLMHAVFAAAQRQTLTLNATSAAESLYVSEGFRPIGTIRQYQGIARPVVLPDAAAFPVRSPTQADGAAIAALDRAALGCDRASILQTLTRDAEGLVHERDGRLMGFAYCRSFGRGAVIGPVIAADETIALALVGPFLSRHGGGFLRADIPEDAPALARLLEDGGLFPAGQATTMIRGRKPRPSGRAPVFGLINQGIG